MDSFSQKWIENEGKPGWIYNEGQQYEELFQHRLGERPDLNVLLSSLPIMEKDKIVKDGVAGRISADETEAVLLDNSRDAKLLEQIYRFTSTFGENTGHRDEPYPWLFGDMLANWDQQTRKGVS